MEDNFVINWLKQYFDKPNLNEKSLKPVLHFSLLWNLFEHRYFTDERHLTPMRLIDLSYVSYNNISVDVLDTIVEFFKARYFPSGQLQDRFGTLLLGNSQRNGQRSDYDLCQSVLTNDNPIKQEKLAAVLLIIHRFRNNLFHGRKNPETLNIYEQPFKEIDKFLIHFIESTADDDSINNMRQIV